jgi:hypothetical protein
MWNQTVILVTSAGRAGVYTFRDRQSSEIPPTPSVPKPDKDWMHESAIVVASSFVVERPQRLACRVRSQGFHFWVSVTSMNLGVVYSRYRAKRREAMRLYGGSLRDKRRLEDP